MDTYWRDIPKKNDKSKSFRSRQLKIRIQGYINDIQYLDTMHVMRAFRSDEKIDVSDYI